VLNRCARAGRAYRSWAPPLLAIAVACVCGCKRGNAVATGNLVGVYAIEGALIENTCGAAALPTANPLRFVVQIRRDNNVGYWQIDKRGTQAGLLEDDGEFRFFDEKTSLVGQTVRTELQPQDFLSSDPDFDLKPNRKCLMTMRETIEGRLGRVLSDAGLEADSGSTGSGGDDLRADNTIEITPTPESDCSAALQALGGSFNALPCHARYVLEGELEDSVP